MDAHERRLKDHGRMLGELLHRLLVSEAGLPRPVIQSSGEMRLLFPVNQHTVRELLDAVRAHRKEFEPPTVLFHVQDVGDPYHRRTVTITFPYRALTTGEPMQRMNDPRPVTLCQFLVPQVPDEWRSEKPLEVLLQAQAKHVRHGVALGVGPIVPCRVPREKAS